MASLIRQLAGGYVNSENDEGAAESIGYFDHVFPGKLLHYNKDMQMTLENSEEGPRNISVTCKHEFLDLSEKVGTGVNERERLAIRVEFRNIAKLIWDHQNSSTKLEMRTPGHYITMEIENSLELEQNLSLRFVGAVRERLLTPDVVPGFAYLGMFAGPTKPKPFERKRANLTSIKQGKMPPLSLMRQLALERHRGSERPMSSEVSHRRKLALDHIHDGVISFNVFAASGSAGLDDTACNNARLILDDDGLIFANDVSERGAAVSSTTRRRMPIPYSDISKWNIIDSSVDVTRNGINLTTVNGVFSFAVENVNHLRVSFEHYYNTMRLAKGLPAQPGTTHGRQLVGIHTLMGESPAPPPPRGQHQVVDEDGNIVKGKPQPKRRSSMSAGMNSVTGMFSSSSSAIPMGERTSVKPHWSKVVVHNGWLTKKGGHTKSWMKRYFVLYHTSQGHFLSYYAEYWDSPLYNPSRKERNMIDLSKITYLRAKSKYRDVPPNSFDIATIEREWTLSADSSESLKIWLQMIAHAVDVDVAIVPDDTLSFAVKARNDPSRRLDVHDYSTILQISSWGVSVQKVTGGEREEIHFWCYTDFYKWSILRQNNKMALSLQIFTSGDFKQKNDFVFRSVDAQAIATAIEYYIEKFMGRMHLRREVDELDDEGNPRPGRASPQITPQPAPSNSSSPKKMSDSSSSSSTASNNANNANTAAASAPSINLLDDLLGGDMPGMGGGMTHEYTEPTKNEQADWASDDEGDGSQEPSLLDMNSPTAASGGGGGNFDTSELLGMMSVNGNSQQTSNNVSFNGQASNGQPHNIEPDIRQHMKGWFDNLVASDTPGLLFKNSFVEVLFKHEYRGSQARVTLKVTNQTQEAFSQLSVKVDNTEPHLRTVTQGENSENMPALQSQTYTIMMECIQPYSEAPQLVVKFSTPSRGASSYTIPLPVLLIQFLTPANLGVDNFLSRWGAMAGGDSLEVPSTLSDAQMAMIRLQQLKLGVEQAPNGNILCAATLNTGFVDPNKGTKVVVGCLIQVAVRQGSLAIAVRTASQQTTACLSAVVANLIKS